MEGLRQRREVRRDAKARLTIRLAWLAKEEERQEQVKIEAAQRLERCACKIQSARRRQLAKRLVLELRGKHASAIRIQAIVRGRFGRKRREELLLERKRVVPKGISLRALLMRSILIRKVDNWKEMRDPETGAVFYYNTSNTETQWDAPFEMNNGDFPCNWGDCDFHATTFETLEVHRRQHNWLCPACWQLNHCDVFPDCANCANQLDIDGHIMGQLVPEALSNDELLMHLQARKLGIFASRQEMIHKLNDVLMRERKFALREKKRKQKRLSAELTSDQPQGSRNDPPEVPAMLRPRLNIEPVPDDRWPHFSVVEARAQMELKNEGNGTGGKEDFLDIERFKEELQRMQQAKQSAPVGLPSSGLAGNKDCNQDPKAANKNRLQSRKSKRIKKKRAGPYQIPDHIDPKTIYGDKIKNGQGRLCIGTMKYSGALVQGQAHGNGKLRYEDGTTFEGEFRHNLRHGMGTLRKSDGTVFQGSWQNNLRHGFGVETSATGDTLEGLWTAGLLNGKARLASANGDVYEGEFLKTRFHGIGAFTKANGDRFIGRIARGLANGPGILKLANGEVYRGHFVDDNRHGYGTCTFGGAYRYVGTWNMGRYDGHGRLENTVTGEIYDGAWELGHMGGHGTLVFANGDIFEGSFSGGAASGQGTFLYRQSGCIYVGNWKNSRKHGPGQLYFGSGAHYVGSFFKGQLHGIGTFTYRDGSVYHGSFFHGKRNGNGKYTFVNGNIYQGAFAENKINGHGTMAYLKHGHRYEGEWKDNHRHGQGTMHFNDTSIYVGDFRHDRMTGTGKFITSPGTVLQEVYEGEIQDGRRHGRGKLSFKDGSIYDGNWHENQRHGKGRFVDSDGMIYEGDFCNGRFHGRGLANFPDGSSYRGDWANGLMHGQGTLTKSNGHVFTGSFVHGQRHGEGRVEYPGRGNRFEGKWRSDIRAGYGTYVLNCRQNPLENSSGNNSNVDGNKMINTYDGGDRGFSNLSHAAPADEQIQIIPGDPETDPMGDALGKIVKLRVFGS